jgi:hypothetical protein
MRTRSSALFLQVQGASQFLHIPAKLAEAAQIHRTSTNDKIAGDGKEDVVLAFSSNEHLTHITLPLAIVC